MLSRRIGKSMVAVSFGPSVNQCAVIFFTSRRANWEPSWQRSVILGYQDQAAGFAIKAMHDARSKLSPNCESEANRCNRALTSVPRLRASSGGSGAGVHHHARRFVDDNQIIVFVNNVKRDIFGDGSKRRLCKRPQNQMSLRRGAGVTLLQGRH